jgi:hypothetical protein
MLIYAMAVPSQFNAGIFKIGEADGRKQLEQREKKFQTSHTEPVVTYGLWDIGPIGKKADNRLHAVFKDRRYGNGGTEFFKDVSLEEIHENALYIFGPNVKRLK